MQNKKDNIEKQINDSKNELKEVDNELSENLKQLQKIDESIQESEKTLQQLRSLVMRCVNLSYTIIMNHTCYNKR